LGKYTPEILEALRCLRDVGVVRAHGDTRGRFARLVERGFANAYPLANGVTDFRLTRSGKIVAGMTR
jgi:hypothetical protein